MPLSLAESQAINSIAAHLNDFLPGTPHPYANQSISFAGVAQNTGLSQLWTGGSKLSAITTLLEKTLETHRSSFCQLISEIVQSSLFFINAFDNGCPKTESERRIWLEEAGFQDIKRLPFPEGGSIIIAEIPD